jgi:hypothetical protein
MSEEAVKKRSAVGFSEQDQEEIANKFQKLADDRKGRTGLGFANVTPSPATTESETKTSAHSKALTQEEKINSLKASIHTIETNHAATVLHRRHAIAHIQDSADVSNSSLPLIHNEHDMQHQNAMFSSQQDANTTPMQTQTPTRSENNESFFNRKKAPVAVDAPLYKRLKVGDTVLAYFAGDEKFHRADIVSVMHGKCWSCQIDPTPSSKCICSVTTITHIYYSLTHSLTHSTLLLL